MNCFRNLDVTHKSSTDVLLKPGNIVIVVDEYSTIVNVLANDDYATSGSGQVQRIPMTRDVFVICNLTIHLLINLLLQCRIAYFRLYGITQMDRVFALS
jgi:hypothetical protein